MCTWTLVALATSFALLLPLAAATEEGYCTRGQQLGDDSEGLTIHVTECSRNETSCLMCCASLPLCTAWSRASDSKNGGLDCVTASVAHEMAARPRPGQYSCSAFLPCASGTDIPGEDLLSAPGVSYEVAGPMGCAQKCMRTAGCAGFASDVSGAAPRSACRLRSTADPAQAVRDGARCSAALRCAAATEPAAPQPAVLATLRNASSGDVECAHACRSRAGCAGYTVRLPADAGAVASTTCELLAGVVAAGDFGKSPRACVSALQCEAGAGRSGGRALGAPFVADDPACARACARTAGCNAFLVTTNANVTRPLCALLGGRVAPATGSPPARECLHVMQCLAGRVSYGAELAPAFRVLAGDAECAAACRKTAGCAGFVVDMSAPAMALCSLKRTLSPMPTRDAQCAASLRCAPRAGLSGTTLAVLRDVRGGDDECAAQCAARSGCAGFVVSYGSQSLHAPQCVLHSSVAAVAEGVASSCSAVMGCVAGQGFGPASAVLSTSDAYDCGRLCRGTARCAAWSVASAGPHAFNCTLYSSANETVPSSSSCAMRLQCRPGLTSAAGAVVASAHAWGGDAECAAICRETRGCAAFVFSDAGRPNCVLRSSRAASPRVAQGACYGAVACTAGTAANVTGWRTYPAQTESECRALCEGDAACTGYMARRGPTFHTVLCQILSDANFTTTPDNTSCTWGRYAPVPAPEPQPEPEPEPEPGAPSSGSGSSVPGQQDSAHPLPTESSQRTEEGRGDGPGSPAGVIVGATVGPIAFLAVAGAVVFVLVRKSRGRRSEGAKQNNGIAECALSSRGAALAPPAGWGDEEPRHVVLIPPIAAQLEARLTQLEGKELRDFDRAFPQHFQMHHEDYTAKRIKRNLQPLTFVVRSAWRVRNERLEELFRRRWAYMRDALGRSGEELDERAAFHGTRPENIAGICRNGLLRAGHPLNPSESTDAGFFGSCGSGVYASRFVEYALQYSNVRTDSVGAAVPVALQEGEAVRLVMFRCLPGRSLHVAELLGPVEPTPGYDSHSSPEWAEWFLFDESQLCPAYVVEVQAVCNSRTVANDGLDNSAAAQPTRATTRPPLPV
eukprot:m51a1_g8377 hypothetical protein (1078) ;mRNA; r:163286-166519